MRLSGPENAVTTQISVQIAKECVQIPGGRRLKTGGGRLISPGGGPIDRGGRLIVSEGALTMGGRYLLVRIDKLTTQRPDNAASRP